MTCVKLSKIENHIPNVGKPNFFKFKPVIEVVVVYLNNMEIAFE